MKYIETTFEEMELKSKGTKYEGTSFHSFLKEHEGTPIVTLEIGEELGIKGHENYRNEIKKLREKS